MRIFLIGFMGSGKTHWGKQLAKQLQIPFFEEKKSVPSPKYLLNVAKRVFA